MVTELWQTQTSAIPGQFERFAKRSTVNSFEIAIL
jgi:hypothetical protein